MFHCTRIKETECKNYRGISLVSMVGKIYAGMLEDRVHRQTEGLIDNEQRSFKARREFVGQIFTLKQIGEKSKGYMGGFMHLEKTYMV